MLLHPLYADAAAAPVVDGENAALEAARAVGRFIAAGQVAAQLFDRKLGLHAQNAPARAGHAEVGDASGAVGQNLLVGGLHMRVRAPDGAHAPVEHTRHRLLLRGRLGVDLHADQPRLQAWQDALDEQKRVVRREIHPAAADQSDHRDIPEGRLKHAPAPTGLLRRLIGRTQQLRRAGDVGHDLAAIKGVVAQRDDVRPGGKNRLGLLRRDADERGVLAVDDAEIDLALPQQLRQTIGEYQQAAKIPLLIGTDEEGGEVVRASRYPQFRANAFQSPRKLYEQGGLDSVLRDAAEKSAFLLDLGINVNLAPVCDLSINPTDYIYSRALGQDAQTTASYVSALVWQMQQSGIGSVLKHFPGYGPNGDTHLGFVRDDRPLETFQAEDFLPFQAGIDAGAPSILVSHNIVSCMDDSLPASLSPAVHRLLRDDLGFDGVIMTDDLSMDAIDSQYGLEESAVLAVLAGNDLLISSDFTTQIPAVLEAVEEGVIPQSQIDSAVLRILRWKQQLGLLAEEENN